MKRSVERELREMSIVNHQITLDPRGSEQQLPWDDRSDPRIDTWFCLNNTSRLEDKEYLRLISHFHNMLMSRQ